MRTHSLLFIKFYFLDSSPFPSLAESGNFLSKCGIIQLKFVDENTQKTVVIADNGIHRQWKPAYEYTTNDTYLAYLTNKNVKLFCVLKPLIRNEIDFRLWLR